MRKKLVYLKLLLPIFCVWILTSCANQTEKYVPKLEIKNHIYDITNIELDTTKFIILMDSIENTEGAFDSDYSWQVKIKINRLYLNTLKNKIKASKSYNVIKWENDEMWKSIDTSKIEGVWSRDSIYFRFIQKPRGYRPEETNIKIDSSTAVLDFLFIHL